MTAYDRWCILMFYFCLWGLIARWVGDYFGIPWLQTFLADHQLGEWAILAVLAGIFVWQFH